MLAKGSCTPTTNRVATKAEAALPSTTAMGGIPARNNNCSVPSSRSWAIAPENEVIAKTTIARKFAWTRASMSRSPGVCTEDPAAAMENSMNRAMPTAPARMP